LKNHKTSLSVMLILVFFHTLLFGNLQSSNNTFGISSVSAAEVAERKLVPIGKSVGVAMEIDGVLVVGTCEILDEHNKYSSPSQKAGIKCGDLIKSLNGEEIDTVVGMNEILNKTCGNTIECTLIRDGSTISTQITPIKALGDDAYKIGVWVKDAASGIGTITYYDPETQNFGALGHGICDAVTGDIIRTHNGDILEIDITTIKRGEKGNPGELTGIFSENTNPLGYISDNSKFGLFGRISNQEFINNFGEPVSILRKKEVSAGKAQILCNVEGEKSEYYDIEIQKLFTNHEDSSKGMIIKICDERLIQKTGGIVQGMSGSPILQNGKLVGAVTHVFVNDPTRGYGIFIENMLSEAE